VVHRTKSGALTQAQRPTERNADSERHAETCRAALATTLLSYHPFAARASRFVNVAVEATDSQRAVGVEAQPVMRQIVRPMLLGT
jgi:hypothetical protein